MLLDIAEHFTNLVYEKYYVSTRHVFKKTSSYKNLKIIMNLMFMKATA